MKNILILLSLSLSLFTSFASADDGQLQVGLAAVDVDPPIGIPLGGYGATERRLPGFIDWQNRYSEAFFFRPSIGRIDPIRSKTMVLKNDKKTLIFTSVDAIGVEDTLIDDILDELKPFGIKREELFLAGTHTHSGPGTLSHRLPLQLIAVDFFRKKNYELVKMRVLESIMAALASLEPADLYKTKYTTHNVQRNKWRKKDQEYFNTTAYLLLAKNKAGKFMGGIVNYAVHGGALDADNLKYSSDLPGGIERALEADLDRRNNGATVKKPVMAFINGAEADVGAKHGGVEGIALDSSQFVEQGQEALDHGLIPVKPELKSVSKKIWFGIPHFPLIATKKGGEDTDTWRTIEMPLIGLMPSRAYISQAQVGDITMAAWPGEVSTSLGWKLQETLIAEGATDPWFLGLTNDYLAYFTNYHEYHEGAYDSQSSLYTWKGGERGIKAHAKLFKKLQCKGEVKKEQPLEIEEVSAEELE